VAILTYGLWERRYSKDQGIIGRTIRVDGVQTNVIGVMPDGLSFPSPNNFVDLWLPLTPGPTTERREARNLLVLGETVGDLGASQVSAALDVAAKNLAQQYPDTNRDTMIVAKTFRDQFFGAQNISVFQLMLGAVTLVLLIACTNVSNLMSAQALKRTREVSLRLALGAGRMRIVRHVVVEALMLSSISAVLGLLLALVGVKAFAASIGTTGPRWMDYSMDYRVVAYFVLVAVATGVLSSLFALHRSLTADISTFLKDGGAATGVRRKYLSGALIVAETALAVVLTIGSGLTLRSFLRVYQSSIGVNADDVLTMRLTLPASRFQGPAQQNAMFDRVVREFQTVPGVASVSVATTLPSANTVSMAGEVEGVPVIDPKLRPSMRSLAVSEGYFQVWGLRAVSGRVFTETDGTNGLPVAIVNQAFANTFSPQRDPVGQRVRLFTRETPGPWMTVVGVIPNVVQDDPNGLQRYPLVYVPFRSRPRASAVIALRTTVPPQSIGRALRAKTQTLDAADLPLTAMLTMEERLHQQHLFREWIAVLFAIFGGVALVLAAMGLYAVVAHAVEARSKEIGIRMSIGASPMNVTRLVLTSGVRQVAIGLAVGLVVALFASRAIGALLVAVSPADPATFAISSVVMIGAAVLGCLVPVRRAVRLNLVTLLREQ